MNVPDWIRESNLIERIDNPEEDRRSALAWDDFSAGPLTPFTLFKLHNAITRTQLLPDESGYFRTCEVEVGGRGCPKWATVPYLMLMWFKIHRHATTEKDIEVAHIEYERIHPFVDGNGRTGRMVMNWQRRRGGMEPLLIKASEKHAYYDWFKALAVVLVLALNGCVSIGYHNRTLLARRQADYEFAQKLVREELTPKQMSMKLKARYRMQEEGRAE